MAKKGKKRGGMIRFSRETMYNAGMEYCDTSIYTVKAPRNVRRKLGRPSRPCQEALNDRNAKLRLKRLNLTAVIGQPAAVPHFADLLTILLKGGHGATRYIDTHSSVCPFRRN